MYDILDIVVPYLKINFLLPVLVLFIFQVFVMQNLILSFCYSNNEFLHHFLK